MTVYTIKTAKKRADHQARIAACRAYGHQLQRWEHGYLASLDIWLRREPILNPIQLGTLHEIHQRAMASQKVSA